MRAFSPPAWSVKGHILGHAGWATIALMFLGKFVFEHLGWGTAALATPTVMLLAGSAFFGLSLAAMTLGGDPASSMLAAGAVAGAVTQVFARSSKFSLFDPAKEMVYIEMTKEEKSKGKAAVDLMGSQAGKSGASWIIQGALLLLGTATACLPVLATAYAVVIAVWARAALRLKLLMADTEALRQQEKQARSAEAEQSAGAGANGAQGADIAPAGSAQPAR
jgi:ATP:ADP antiporter, AAA family